MDANRVILRTPFYPFRSVPLKVLLTDKIFHEAIYLASPTLFKQLQKSIKGELDDAETTKLYLSLLRYYLRMSYRCTPFGLFAGISIGQIGDSTSINIEPQKYFNKNTRLDSHFLNSWAQYISREPEIMNCILWFANNTHYTVGENIRYVEYRLEKSVREHFLSEIVHSDYVEFALELTKKGSTLPDLKTAIVNKYNVSETESDEFVYELVNAKLLLSELEPQVTGDEYHTQLLRKLNRSKIPHKHVEWLKNQFYILSQIDNLGPGAPISLYEKITAQVETYQIELGTIPLFQSDLVKPVQDLVLGHGAIEELKKCIALLEKITPASQNPRQKKFKEEFTKRYEEEELPLLTVIDSELGIGYPASDHSQLDNTPLLDGIYIDRRAEQNKNSNLSINPWANFLSEKYKICLQGGSQEIVITDNEVDQFFTENKNSKTNSMFTICNILAATPEDVDRGKFEIIHNITAGPSAANLLGRFCHADKQITDLVTALTNSEQSENTDVIFAEIVHIPQARLGNILMRPAFRNYEIPIITQPGVKTDHSITLDDIMVSVRNDKIILRSKRLNARIVPRLTTAHNFSVNPLPLYYFLCDLQSQNEKDRLSWDWYHLRDFSFLPRVRYKKNILSKAKWKVHFREVGFSENDKLNHFQEKFKAFCKKESIPRHVQLSQEDNVLPLDLLEESSLMIVKSELKKFKTVLLEESLFNDNNLLVRSSEGKFTNEFIIPWTESKTNLISTKGQTGVDKKITRHYPPGTEWHFLKIYCGVKTADKILCDIILPLTTEMLNENTISKWFFIRYNDPDNHLRIRFKVTPNSHTAIVERFNNLLIPYLEKKLIWKIQIDTYQREIERYGANNIENSESIFFYDSIASAKVLSLLDGDEGDNLRTLFAFKGTDDLLSAFGYNLEEKKKLMNRISTFFLQEHSTENINLKKALSNRYRLKKHQLEGILTSDTIKNNFTKVWNIFEERKMKIEMCARQMDHLLEKRLLTISKDDLVTSYLHMFLNRFFRSKQRLQETVTYDWLHQFYRSEIGKKKNTPNT